MPSVPILRLSTLASAQLDRRDAREMGTRMRSSLLRVALLAGCVGAVGLAVWVGRPEQYLAADPELARLLRAMALIKAALVLGAVAILLWRFGYSLAPRLAAVYLLGVWAMAGASMMVWQLSALVLSAMLFHTGGVAVLIAAWHDGKAVSS